MANSVFFPQDALDEWIVGGLIDLSRGELMITQEGRRYKVIEAVRVLSEVTGAGDPNKLVGKVKANTELQKIGAEIMEGSMILGDAAYDVAPGWMGTPVGSFDEHLRSIERTAARVGMDPFQPASEEHLLSVVLGGKSP